MKARQTKEKKIERNRHDGRADMSRRAVSVSPRLTDNGIPGPRSVWRVGRDPSLPSVAAWNEPGPAVGDTLLLHPVLFPS